MEGLGKKLQHARVARGLTLDEAGRLTKIRPGRLQEIENEDFSQFASLAYAKGFLLIYGKFLEVDVAQYLDAFETSEHVTVDGYAYLQDNPAPAPSRPVVMRKQSSSRGSLMPLVIGVVVLVVGVTVMKMFLTFQRIKPSGPHGTTIGTASTAIATSTPEKIVAPRAQPAENATAPPSTALVTATPPPPVESPAPSEPEVRRAEAVHPDDLAKATQTGALNRVEIRALKKTYLKVVVDDEQNPTFERTLTPVEGPVQIRGKHIRVSVTDSDFVQIKNVKLE